MSSHKAKNRHNSEFVREKVRQAHSVEQEPTELDLSGDFDPAADDGRSGKGGDDLHKGR